MAFIDVTAPGAFTTPQKRDLLLKAFRIRPVVRFPALSGRPKDGADGPLRGPYVVFRFQNKALPDDEGGFYAGPECGGELMFRTGQDAPALFDPRVDQAGGGPALLVPAEGRDPVAAELRCALLLLSLWRERPPGVAILDAVLAAEERPAEAPGAERLALCAEIARRVLPAGGLSEALAELARWGGRPLRPVAFPALAAALAELGVAGTLAA